MRKKKVLVVDDSKSTRQQVSLALTQAGFEVVEADDGVAGSEAMRAHRDVGMVICDLNMPRMNGLELVETIKADPANADLPIIMLSTEGQPGLMKRARQAGAKGWLVKPFKAQMLVSTAEKLTAGA